MYNLFAMSIIYLCSIMDKVEDVKVYNVLSPKRIEVYFYMNKVLEN